MWVIWVVSYFDKPERLSLVSINVCNIILQSVAQVKLVAALNLISNYPAVVQ